jgi:hypothetical protein
VSNDNDDGSAGRKNLFAAPVGRRCALSGEVYPLWLCAFPLMLPLVDGGSPSPSGTQLESGSSFTLMPVPMPIPMPVVASVVFLRLFFALALALAFTFTGRGYGSASAAGDACPLDECEDEAEDPARDLVCLLGPRTRPACTYSQGRPRARQREQEGCSPEHCGSKG